jgi:hypothetical protein
MGVGDRHMVFKVEVEFDEFGWEALTDEARRQDVTVEALVVHAAMHYLADADRERFSHRVPRGEAFWPTSRGARPNPS